MKKSILFLSTLVALSLATMFANDRKIVFWSGGNIVGEYWAEDIERIKIEEWHGDIYPLNELGDTVSSIKSWGVPHAKVDFIVNPVELLDEYSIEDGTIKAELDGLEPCTIVDGNYNGELITIDRSHSIVSVHFTSPKVAGKGKVTLTLGDDEKAISASVDVIMHPAFQFASFYGETAGHEIAAMPYLNGRPSLGTLTVYIASRCEKVIDINSDDEVRVAMNIEGGTDEDIREAVKCYEWKHVSGDALLVTRDDYEIVPGHGFDAIIGVRSGLKTGKVVYECETPCVTAEDPDKTLTLTLIYNVVNIKKEYPIREINLDSDEMVIEGNDMGVVKMSVVPMSSYAYQKVKVEVGDPSIVKVMGFEGCDLPIQGLKPGTTTLTFSAYNDTELVTKTVKVTVKDKISRVEIDTNTGEGHIFVGATTSWKANAYNLSGMLVAEEPLTWASANNSVATVDNNGVVTGMAPGVAGITASSGYVKSSVRSIRVIAAPDAISDASGFMGFYEDGDDIVFLDADESGYLYIPGGYANGEFAGTYTLSGAYYMNSDAKAPATGTVIIGKAGGEYEYIVTMDVNINLSSTKSVSFKFSNGILEYLPE